MELMKLTVKAIDAQLWLAIKFNAAKNFEKVTFLQKDHPINKCDNFIISLLLLTSFDYLFNASTFEIFKKIQWLILIKICR
jgi:hypothetical protein